jgi:1-deoxy-D-xylulose-5-phosphate reductoisomerase
MKKLSILGATGSIGRNTLEIVAQFTDHYRVVALTAKQNVDLLAKQIQRFHPHAVAVYTPADVRRLKDRLPADWPVEIFCGPEGYNQAAAWGAADTVVTAMVGAAGLLPTLAAIDAGKHIALANKETLVMAGELVMQRAAARGVSITPVDSEHSAIFQCLQGQRRQEVSRILLTASGGPLREQTIEAMATIVPAEALNHPTWSMGAKITIDSATLMNKGLEVIEACHLFNVDVDSIEVVVHPQSIVHSMVAFCDGSVLAQMGIPDMKEAIAYALSHPQRLPLGQPLPDFGALGALTFEKPDLQRFACLGLALQAARTGGTVPAVMNAANEIAVAAFLDERIGFLDISRIIAGVMERHRRQSADSLETILAADAWARQQAELLVGDGKNKQPQVREI